MNRRGFCKNIWYKAIKPILLIVLIYLSIIFLTDLVTSAYENRGFIIFLVSICIIYFSISLIGTLFILSLVKLQDQFSEKWKLRLRIIGKFLSYLYPLILGVMLYQFWLEDWITASFLISFLLIQELRTCIASEINSSTENS
ncbi:MAG: hypothetical protein ACI9N1_001166 [Flavobacteriales bacterium]|jgi:hypothetical protein